MSRIEPPTEFHDDEECHCCGHREVELKWYGKPFGFPSGDSTDPRDHHSALCRVCATTFFSKAIHYPRQCVDDMLYRSIAWSVNEILLAIARIS